MSEHAYIPAAGRDWLLPFYDVFVRLSGMKALQQAVVAECRIAAGQRVLDVGCGTGSLVVMIKQAHPEALVTGIDPDPKALARAAGKRQRSGVEVTLDRGFAQELPYHDASFERVVSSFMFHHLSVDAKRGMLREVLRVLVPGGELHLVDFNPLEQRKDGLFARLVHSDAELADNAGGRIMAYLEEAGFKPARETFQRSSLYGRVGCFRGVRPAE